MKKVDNTHEQKRNYNTVMENTRNIRGSSRSSSDSWRTMVPNRSLYQLNEAKINISGKIEGKYKRHIFIILMSI